MGPWPSVFLSAVLRPQRARPFINFSLTVCFAIVKRDSFFFFKVLQLVTKIETIIFGLSSGTVLHIHLYFTKH